MKNIRNISVTNITNLKNNCNKDKTNLRKKSYIVIYSLIKDVDNLKIERTIKKILNKLKKNTTREANKVRKINYEELVNIVKENSNVIIVDTRSPQEYAENRIKFAINIPVYEIENEAYSIIPDKEKTIILYCQSGIRSEKAYKILEKMGYTNLYNLEGGLDNI